LVNKLADSAQITVEGAVIEGTQSHEDTVMKSQEATGQVEEGQEALGGSMSIRGWEEVVAGPQQQIRQCQLANGHDLVFRMVEFVHSAFLSIEGV
jgi:hypothetical protein